MNRILIVGDQEPSAKLIGQILHHEGYDIEIVGRGDALSSVLSPSASLVVLDFGQEKAVWIALLSDLRSRSSAPIVIVSTAGSEEDRIEGLERGADDYIPKPFNPRELLARVRAVLRRTLRE